KTRDGRVIKLEGNPDHPVNAGALCIRGQASLQGLYHPDRYRGAMVAGKPAAWDEAEKALVEKLQPLVKGKQGNKIASVAGLERGSVGKLMEEWTRALGARPRIQYEPIGYEALRAANRATFGRDGIPYYAIEDADYLLSFGADFLETWGSLVANTAAYTKMHAFANGKAGTFVAVGPRPSMTSAHADEWGREAPRTPGMVAPAMLKGILGAGAGGKGGGGGSRGAGETQADPARVGGVAAIPADTIKRLAHDFASAKSALALAGGVATTGPQATDALIAVNLLNQAVGAVGKTVRFGADTAVGKASPYADMVKLTKAMAAGEIEVLILADVNPVYAMPPKAGFVEALAKVPTVLSIATRPTETSAKAMLLLPALHPLESWGDYVAR